MLGQGACQQGCKAGRNGLSIGRTSVAKLCGKMKTQGTGGETELVAANFPFLCTTASLSGIKQNFPVASF